jgi:hypothetical protein
LSGRFFRLFLMAASMALLIVLSMPRSSLLQAGPAAPSSAAAQSPDDDSADDVLTSVTSPDFLNFARALPPYAGLIVAAVSLIPLLWGWRILQAFMMAFFGVCFAAVGLAIGLTRWGPVVGVVLGALAAVGGAFLGKYALKLNRALLVAVLCGFIAAIPGALLQSTLLALTTGVAGAAAGLWLGWKYSRYVDAVETTLLGAGLTSAGSVIVVRDFDPILIWMTAAAAYIAAIALGISVQFRAVSEHLQWEHRHDHLKGKKSAPRPK